MVATASSEARSYSANAPMRAWISCTSASVAWRIMDNDELMAVLRRTVEAVRSALDGLGELDSWGLAGTRPGQYFSDLAADPAAVDILLGAGCGVLSEESATDEIDRDVVVVVDPVDGSTNASRGVPWF